MIKLPSTSPRCRCAHSALVRTPGLEPCHPERCNPHFDPFDGVSPEYNWFKPRDPLVVRVLDRLIARAPRKAR